MGISTLNQSEVQASLEATNKRIYALYEQGHYEESLNLCLEITRTHPDLWNGWNNTAVNLIHLNRWQEAIDYAQAALACDKSEFGPYDTLAHAHSMLEQWDEAHRYGLQALNLRVQRFNDKPVIPSPEPGAMPPPPSARTRQRNVIAFSLFGDDPKYCETAVLNVQDQPSVYPHWVCRFYVDASVPGHIISRLREGGAQIEQVEGTAAQWPGPMWRFLALDDPKAHRILFRDADAVISRREAKAVQQWIASDKRFHIMRDSGSHTELMMAGLWGVVGGSLPPLVELVRRFMSQPVESAHFADQSFLRQYVWPYARQSLMQHDSVFGFMEAAEFPDKTRPPDGFHVGGGEGAASFTAKTDLPNGSEITWELYRTEKTDDGQTREESVCAYPGTVQDGAVKGHIPVRYRQWLKQGTAKVRLIVPQATQHKMAAQAQLQLDAAQNREKALEGQGRYQEALDICLEITRTYPQVSGVWLSAAVNCLHLARWQDAIHYGQTALTCGEDVPFDLYDVLAHAHGSIGQWDEARRYGLQALNLRAERFDGELPIPWPKPAPMPPPPSAQTRERNIIAFPLFGQDPKYCETAILNVQEQPGVYPHWICRFYVDASVPNHVIDRLRKGGAEIVQVNGPAAQWPGPMWRFLALDDPQAHRILFRDADAVISPREAGAVQQWVASGKRFHMMRDSGAHTELLMAGMWGVVAGSLPPLEQLMQRFMSTPPQSRRFADQHFLRQYVWPYARQNLAQHDSVFGFMDAQPFPDRAGPTDVHVGGSENPPFTAKSNLPDGSEVTWGLFRIEKGDDGQVVRQELVCAYPATVKNGTFSAHIPGRYARWIQQGTAGIRLVSGSAA